jgi:outer membrane protein assembly factor BamE (lipoprotein component of BamABCDE complex)
MKPAIVALLSILVLSSCASGPKMNRLHEGMTKSEVLSAVGSPDGYQRSGEYEVLLYVDRNTTPWTFFGGYYRDVSDYSVILKDNQVVEYGPGRTHQRDSEVSPFVRIPSR